MADKKKISTADIPDAKEGGVAKTLQPGNVVIKVNSITIKKEPFEGEPLNIVLHCEGEPLGGDFQGFEIDREKPELGLALGQVGNVRASEYAFKDGMASKKVLNKDKDMLEWLMNFHKAIDKVEWLKSQGDFDTVEELISHINTTKPFKDIWLNACLAGRGYINNKGFLNYDLFLPWFNNSSVPLEIPGTLPSRLTRFEEIKHIKAPKKKAATVEGFTGKKATPGELEL